MACLHLARRKALLPAPLLLHSGVTYGLDLVGVEPSLQQPPMALRLPTPHEAIQLACRYSPAASLGLLQPRMSCGGFGGDQVATLLKKLVRAASFVELSLK